MANLFGKVQRQNISAFQPEVLRSEPVLAYWEGFNSNQGYGFGSIKILNSSYQEIYDVAISGEEHNFVTGFGPMSSYIDLHENHITEEGTILVTAVNVTRADMSSVGGPKNGWVRDGLFYEIDIQSNDIIFRWSTLEYLSDIPMTNAEVPLAGKGHSMSDPWDYAHLNSVAKYGENYLVSSRHTCSISCWQERTCRLAVTCKLTPKICRSHINNRHRVKKAATSHLD